MTWINASELYNWAKGNAVIDWLDRYGEQKGLAKDAPKQDYLEAADLGLFTRRKGNEFEHGVVDLIRQKVSVADVEGARGNHDAAAEKTRQLMQQGQEAIFQGLVRDEEYMIFGVPDLLIRGDVLMALFAGSLEDPGDAYHVVDIKYKGLRLNKKGDLGSTHKWEKVQLGLYERVLARTCQRDPRRSFLLGRSASGASGGCFDLLGWVNASDPKISQMVDEGLQWIRDLRERGAAWTLDPPSDPRLRPPPNEKNGGGWSGVLTDLRRESEGLDDDAPNIAPDHIAANRAEWIENPGIEFYVDFETLSNLNDDFSTLPKVGGRPMIFMVGCGHEEDGEFQFKVWTALEETYEEERRIIDEWLAHMDETRRRLAPHVERPGVFHWSHHESSELGKAADRHTQPAWKNVPWYDLLAKVMKASPVIAKGANGHGLKSIARSMKAMELIERTWGDSAVSGGEEAMAAAWWCYEKSRALAIPANQVTPDGSDPLMPQIEEYNEIDCRVMWEILRYLRQNH